MASDSYLAQLNEAQRAAVEYMDGPELVIAGAGSGKTRVLTYKIVHLLAMGYNPRRILALTFTNKAAREMRQRIEQLAGADVASQLWMGTFHSIFSRILRIHADRIGFRSNFTIYDASDSKSLVKSIIKELKLDDKTYRPGQVLADISYAKNQLYSPEDYAADRELMNADRSAGRGRTADIFAIYHERCRIAGAMDFDDLLYYTSVLLRDNPDLCERYRSYFAYVLVDEYQDTNFAQHHIVTQLSGAGSNLCVVGDDAQSIYSFRGANIMNILTLEKRFPGLRIFKLEENYRSTQNIIGAANTLIAANRRQIAKDVFSRKEPGDRIEVMQCYNEYEEAYVVAGQVSRTRMKLQVPYSEIAILYRTNAQSRILEEALRNRNIPYRIYGGQSFYARKEIKDAVSYFRLAVNPADDEAFRRVLNTPRRGIGETTEKKVLAAAIAAGVSMYDVATDPARHGMNTNAGTTKKLQDFAALIRGFAEADEAGVPANTLARTILEKSGLAAEYVSDTTPENIARQENIEELIKGVDVFVDNSRQTDGEGAVGMTNYLADISLLTDQDEGDGTGDKVTLMTIHAAKGLEFGAVFIVGVEDSIIPSERSHMNAAQVEEERRLMYVAITRAERFCMITYAKNRMINGRTEPSSPSRFLVDIDPRFLRATTDGRHDDFRPSAGSYGRNSFNRDEFDPFEHHRSATAASAQAATLRGRSAIPPVHRAPGAPARPAVPPSSPSAGAAGDGFVTHTAAELREGMRIEHKSYGLGVIRKIDTEATDHRITVHFSSSEAKTLLLKFARFRILS